MRATLPAELTAQQANDLLNAVAFHHRDEGWGLLSKTTGNNVNGQAVDILFNRTEGKIYDVLESGPDASTNTTGPSRPSMQDKGSMDLTRWMPPRGALPMPVPPDPSPQPAPEPELDLSQLTVLLTELVTQVKALISSNEALAAQVRDKQFSVKLKF